MRAIQQTLQVTKAMSLISTAKLRKGRRVLEDTDPFFTRIQKSMYDILAAAEHPESEFFTRSGGNRGRADSPPGGHSAVVVVTSDKGLAGGYNANICRHVTELCSRLENPVLIFIGSIGYRYFVNSPLQILENFSFHSKLPDMDDARQIADYIVSQYQWGMFDEIYMVYTHMYSAVKLQPAERHILPLDAETMKAELAQFDNRERVALQFEYLPSPEQVFDALVPLYIRGIIYGSMVQAYVSEQSARMTAMEESSKNAEEMLAALRLNYNRVRQAGITQEMTEIISGSAALN
jgi:F-type H+-transporting ATPase subunit gamma